MAAQGSKVPENGGTGLHTGTLRISVSHRDKILFAFSSLWLTDIPFTDTALKYSHFTVFPQSSHIIEMIHQARAWDYMRKICIARSNANSSTSNIKFFVPLSAISYSTYPYQSTLPPVCFVSIFHSCSTPWLDNREASSAWEAQLHSLALITVQDGWALITSWSDSWWRSHGKQSSSKNSPALMEHPG